MINNTNRSLLANYLLGQGSSSTQGKNYVKNSFGMNGTANVSVGGAGGTPAAVTKNTTTPLTGISDFAITLPNDATNYVEWALDTLDNSLANQNCQLTFDYKITSIGSVVQAQVLINGAISVSQTLAASPTQSTLTLTSPCGDLTQATTVRISNYTANSGTSAINVANMNYGKFILQQQAAVASSQTDYSGSTYALTSGNTQGIGTPANAACTHDRVGGNLILKCKFTSGTATSAEMRVNLPTGLVVADTSRVPTIMIVGNAAMATTNGAAANFTILAEPSVGYVTFGNQDAANGGLVKYLGDSLIGNSHTMSFYATIPIQTWTSSQRAPTLIGSITSSASVAIRHETVYVTGSATTPTLSLGTNASTAWLNSTVTRNSIGDYSFVILGGVFSATPICQISSVLPSGTATLVVNPRFRSITNTSMNTLNVEGTGASVSGFDGDLLITCDGPR